MLEATEAAAEETFAAPDLGGQNIMIVAPGEMEASLMARRLIRWGASVCVATGPDNAAALLPERRWDAVLLDQTLGPEAFGLLARMANYDARRIVLTTPGERHGLAALKDNGFAGYLVKPVRAASLAAQLSPASAAGPRAADAAEPRSKREPRGLSILVAEDNEINALLARALLTRLGHRPTLATSGGAAFESYLAARAAGAPYDLVLMDVHMPDVDGIEATRRIRAAEADQARVPIVALTADALAEDRDACIAAGMDGFLVKPLDRDRLAATLDTLAARASLAA
jgi:CheY-like chemotaxis protein